MEYPDPVTPRVQAVKAVIQQFLDFRVQEGLEGPLSTDLEQYAQHLQAVDQEATIGLIEQLAGEELPAERIVDGIRQVLARRQEGIV